jgi:hypothetical protein
MAIAGVLEALAASEGISRSLAWKLPKGLEHCQDDAYALRSFATGNARVPPQVEALGVLDKVRAREAGRSSCHP